MGHVTQAAGPMLLLLHKTPFSPLFEGWGLVWPEWGVLTQGGQHHLPGVHTIHMCVGLQLRIINTSNNQGWSEQSWAQQLQPHGREPAS